MSGPGGHRLFASELGETHVALIADDVRSIHAARDAPHPVLDLARVLGIDVDGPRRLALLEREGRPFFVELGARVALLPDQVEVTPVPLLTERLARSLGVGGLYRVDDGYGFVFATDSLSHMAPSPDAAR